MTAKYEWRDETNLGHPSLVYLDITEVTDDLYVPFEQLLEQAEIVRVKQIDSFDAVFNKGRLDLRRVRMKGYEFHWHHRVMNSEYYALFVAFKRKETKENINIQD